MQANPFQDAVAVVTGGASGIGLALAKAMALRGARVILADRQTGPAEDAARAIAAAGGQARAAELDVRSFGAFRDLIDRVVDEYGRIDFLFNNAGIVVAGPAADYELKDWNNVIDVNLRGVTNGIQAAYPHMRAQRRGHIVNTASMAGLFPVPLVAGYVTTKYAVVGLSKALRVEAAAHGVHVSVLCPGAIRTPILEGGGRYGKLNVDVDEDGMNDLIERMRPMDPVPFATKVLDAVAKNRAIIIQPWWARIPWYLDRILPGLWPVLGAYMYRRYLREQADRR